MDPFDDRNEISRRSAIKKGAAVGAAAFVIPAISTVSMSRASAQATSGSYSNHGSSDGNNNDQGPAHEPYHPPTGDTGHTPQGHSHDSSHSHGQAASHGHTNQSPPHVKHLRDDDSPFGDHDDDDRGFRRFF